MIEENFIKLFEKSFKENWELPALTNYSKEGECFTYGDIAKEIAHATAYGLGCVIDIGLADGSQYIFVYGGVEAVDRPVDGFKWIVVVLRGGAAH